MPLPLVVIRTLPETSRRLNCCVVLSDEPTVDACTLIDTLTVRLLRAGTFTCLRLNVTVAGRDWLVFWFFSVKVTRLELLFTRVSFLVPR